MAHEIEFVNGVAQMAYAGETPWHGLGAQVSNDLTPRQIMQKAGLDWSVEKEDVFTASGVKVPGKKALVRDDGKILDMVGDDWNPVQNDQAFEFFSEFVLAGDMEMNCAGSLKDGKMYSLSQKSKSHSQFLEKTKLTPIFCLAILTNMVKLLIFALLPFVSYAIIHSHFL